MILYPESALLPVSGLQHLAYCERQCALIHVEQVWAENVFTSRGRVFHERAHEAQREVRETTVSTFSLPVRSLTLGLYGVADAVEFQYSDRTLSSVISACPIEYKVGKPKKGDHDVVQLTAQAMCLEEMLGIVIDRGALYYGKTRHRLWIDIENTSRTRLVSLARRFHELVEQGETPRPAYAPEKCDSCSLVELCRPKTVSNRSALAFLKNELRSDLGRKD